MEDTTKLGLISGLDCFHTSQNQKDTIQDIYNFHKHTEIPPFEKPQAQMRFLNKCGEFFLKQDRLYRKNGDRPPLLVITEPEHKHSILLHAHEKLGHCGIFAVTAVVKARFFWIKMRNNIYHHVKSCHECQI